MTIGKTKKLNNDRKYSGGGPRPDNRKIKQEESTERLKHWQGLSPVQQLKELDRRFGEGQGAAKQRRRILAGIEQAKNPRKPSDVKKVVEAIEPGETERLKAKDRRALERKERPSK